MANPNTNWPPSSDPNQWLTQPQAAGPPPEDEDNFNRSWGWDSGNARGIVHESRQSWTSSTQVSTPQVITTYSAPPLPSTPALAMPVMQPLMPAMPSMQDFHQQSQQMMDNAMSFHQRTFDSHNRMVENLNNSVSMSSMSIQSSYVQPQQQIAYHSSTTRTLPVQQQITYQSSPPPVQQQPPPQIHYTQNVYHQAAPQAQPQQLQAPPQQQMIAGPDESARFRAIEQTRDSDMRNVNEQATAMNTRMRNLEQQLKDQRSQGQQVKQLEQQTRDLQNQIAESARRQLDDARRHEAAMEELRRSQRSTPQPQAAALDMDALRKVILETQAKQISAADVQRAVEEAVAQRMVGVARKEDLDAASSSMQKALSKMPQGASEEQVQNAFGKELNKIVDRVQRHQRREIEAALPQQQQPWSRSQPEFTVEEIDDEPVAAPARGYPPAPAPALPPQPAYQAQPAPAQLQRAPQPAPIARTHVPANAQTGAAVASAPHTSSKTKATLPAPIEVPMPTTAVARSKKQPVSSAAPAGPARASAAPPNVAVPVVPAASYAPVAGVPQSGPVARLKNSGDSGSARPPSLSTTPTQSAVPQNALVAPSAPQSGAVARVKKPHAASSSSTQPASVMAPTQQYAPVASAAPPSGAIARIKKPHDAVATTQPAPAHYAPASASAASAASPSGAIARVRKPTDQALHPTASAIMALPAPAVQTAPMSGSLARVKKPSAPPPTAAPAPVPAPSTAMVRPGSRNTATTPANPQSIHQASDAPPARPPRQLTAPPAPQAAPSDAMVRQSKDVAKKPR